MDKYPTDGPNDVSEEDGDPVMGSITYQKGGRQKHWTDGWHKFLPSLARRIRQRKSLPGQKFLFGDTPIDDADPNSGEVMKQPEKSAIDYIVLVGPQAWLTAWGIVHGKTSIVAGDRKFLINGQRVFLTHTGEIHLESSGEACPTT